MFALRGLRSATGECAHLPRQAVAVAMQQARRMSAGGACRPTQNFTALETRKLGVIKLFIKQRLPAVLAADDEDEALYVNWWDAPTNPGIWHRHHVSFASKEGRL